MPEKTGNSFARPMQDLGICTTKGLFNQDFILIYTFLLLSREYCNSQSPAISPGLCNIDFKGSQRN